MSSFPSLRLQVVIFHFQFFIPVTDTWRINNRINLYLLDAIAPESLDDAVTMKGRTVGATFAHLHNVRLMWLKSAAPELLEGVAKIEGAEANDPARLREGLERSGEAIAMLLDKAAAEGGMAPRSAPSRSDRAPPQGRRDAAGQESRVRDVGVGKSVKKDGGRCVLFRVGSSIRTRR